MQWAHDETRITDNARLMKPGALVHINFDTCLPIFGNRPPVPHVDHYDYNAKGRHGSRPIGMVLNLDNLETFYLVLVEDTKYWVLVTSVTSAKSN